MKNISKQDIVIGSVFFAIGLVVGVVGYAGLNLLVSQPQDDQLVQQTTVGDSEVEEDVQEPELSESNIPSTETQANESEEVVIDFEPSDLQLDRKAHKLYVEQDGEKIYPEIAYPVMNFTISDNGEKMALVIGKIEEGTTDVISIAGYLYEYDFATKQLRQFEYFNGNSSLVTPLYNPDGKYIAIGMIWNLVLLDVDTGEGEIIDVDGWYEPVRWGEDGKSLIVVTRSVHSLKEEVEFRQNEAGKFLKVEVTE